MATHKSAEKRHRQSLKRRSRNRVSKAAVRQAIKETRLAVEGGDSAKAIKLLQAAERLIAKAGTKGIFHRRNASRKVSRLAAYVSKGSAGKTSAKKAK